MSLQLRRRDNRERPDFVFLLVVSLNLWPAALTEFEKRSAVEIPDYRLWHLEPRRLQSICVEACDGEEKAHPAVPGTFSRCVAPHAQERYSCNCTCSMWWRMPIAAGWSEAHPGVHCGHLSNAINVTDKLSLTGCQQECLSVSSCNLISYGHDELPNGERVNVEEGEVPRPVPISKCVLWHECKTLTYGKHWLTWYLVSKAHQESNNLAGRIDFDYICEPAESPQLCANNNCNFITGVCEGTDVGASVRSVLDLLVVCLALVTEMVVCGL